MYEVSVTSLPSNLCLPVINIHCLHTQISVSGYRPSLPPDTEICCCNSSAQWLNIRAHENSSHLSISNPCLISDTISQWTCSYGSHWQMSIYPSPMSRPHQVICSQPSPRPSDAFGIYLSEWHLQAGDLILWFTHLVTWALNCSLCVKLNFYGKTLHGHYGLFERINL